MRPLGEFLRAETASGALLLVAVLAAIVWANSAARNRYVDLWSTDLSVTVAGHRLALDLRGWVNDGLMTVFFFVVGLEIKRELAQGELRDRRSAMLPVVAAVGGMVVPALCFVGTVTMVGGSAPDQRGWGVPMATDIAIAVGVLTLLGRRVAPAIKLFVLSLAIVDDIGAIVVIALFYGRGVRWLPLIGALITLLVAAGLRRARIWSVFPWVFLGTMCWLALHESGIHATMTGVAFGLLTPTTPRPSRELVADEGLAVTKRSQRARDPISVVEWLEHRLHPWSSFVVMPIFALANAGVTVDRSAIADAWHSPVARGIAVGLLLGKPVGIVLGAWLAVRLGITDLPSEVRWPQMVGAGILGGIGFTVSLFVTELAYDDATQIAAAKVAVLATSIAAAAVGALVLSRAAQPARGTTASV